MDRHVDEYAAFFREHFAEVVSVAAARLDSRPDAEEVAVDTFRVAWQRWAAGGELTRAWLYGVLRNRIGNEYRSRARREALQELLVADYTASLPIRLAEDPAEVPATDSEILAILESLPQPYRVVLRMTYWDDLLAPEVAQSLGISETTVRARLTRGRKLFKAALQEPRYRQGSSGGADEEPVYSGSG